MLPTKEWGCGCGCGERQTGKTGLSPLPSAFSLGVLLGRRALDCRCGAPNVDLMHVFPSWSLLDGWCARCGKEGAREQKGTRQHETLVRSRYLLRTPCTRVMGDGRHWGSWSWRGAMRSRARGRIRDAFSFDPLFRCRSIVRETGRLSNGLPCDERSCLAADSPLPGRAASFFLAGAQCVALPGSQGPQSWHRVRSLLQLGSRATSRLL